MKLSIWAQNANMNGIVEMLDKSLSMTLDQAIQAAMQYAQDNILDPRIYNVLLSKLNATEQAAFTSALLQQNILVLPEDTEPEELLAPAVQDSGNVDQVVEEIQNLIDSGISEAREEAQILASKLSISGRKKLGALLMQPRITSPYKRG